MSENETRPMCDHVYDTDSGSTKFHKRDPSDSDTFIRCTKHSVVSFTLDDGTRYCGCEFHAPEEAMKKLNIPFPRQRDRKDTISV